MPSYSAAVLAQFAYPDHGSQGGMGPGIYSTDALRRVKIYEVTVCLVDADSLTTVQVDLVSFHKASYTPNTVVTGTSLLMDNDVAAVGRVAEDWTAQPSSSAGAPSIRASCLRFAGDYMTWSFPGPTFMAVPGAWASESAVRGGSQDVTTGVLGLFHRYPYDPAGPRPTVEATFTWTE